MSDATAHFERLDRRRKVTEEENALLDAKRSMPPVSTDLLESVVWPAVEARKEHLGIKSQDDDLVAQLTEAHKAGDRARTEAVIDSFFGKIRPSRD